MIRSGKRIVASLLCAALLMGQLGATAYAEGPPNAGGLCEHHTAHDAAVCGFVEAIPGHDCEHKHGLECYTDALICGMDEGEEQTASGSDAGHWHGQDCHGLDCPHERGGHDEACGYVDAVAGTPCGYVCHECAGEPDKDSGTTSGNTPAPVEPELGTVEPEGVTVTVTAFDELESSVKVQSLPLGAPESHVSLPATLGASGYTVADDTEPAPEPITITGVTWELTGEKDTPTVYEEGQERPCNYYFQPVLPKGYELAGDAELPKIEVRYGWATRANTGGNYDTDDVTAFRAILGAHPSLKNVPGVDEKDPASWETAGLVTWDQYTSPMQLVYLYIDDKGLTGTLNVSGLTNLRRLDCYNNGLTALNGLSNLPELKKLYCDSNSLNELDLSGLTQLTDLSCFSNPFTSFTTKGGHTLTVAVTNSGTVQLTNYNMDTNQVKLTAYSAPGYMFEKWERTDDGAGGTQREFTFTLDRDVTVHASFAVNPDADSNGYHDGDEAAFRTLLDAHPSLKNIAGLDENDPASWGLGQARLVIWDGVAPSRLVTLYLFDKGLEGTLDVSGLTALTHLSCGTNKLKTLDVSGTALTRLHCYENELMELTGVSGLSTLQSLDCSKNQLEKLNVTGTALTELYCGSNPLTKFTDKNGKTLTITAGTGGKAVINRYAPSTNDVWLLATPDSNYMFQEWTGLPAGASNTKYTNFNLSDNISVSAVFARAITPVTGVTLDKPTLTLTTGQTAALTATVEPANASNKAVIWESSSHSVATVSNGVVTAAAPGTATITVTTTDGGYQATCVVTVNSHENPGDDNGNDTNDYTITTPEPPKPNNPVLAVIELPVSVTEGKPATGTADDGRTSAALAEVGKKAGAKQNGIAVRYDTKTSLSYDGFSITIMGTTLDRLTAAKVKYVTLNTGIVDLTFDLATLTEIQKQAAGDSGITLTATREKNLTGAALEAVGSRPAYRLAVNYTGADGKPATVDSFGAGRVTVGVAYTPAATEQAGSLYLVYSKDGQGVEWLYQSSYDRTGGNVISSVGHFSVYGVGYQIGPDGARKE